MPYNCTSPGCGISWSGNEDDLPPCSTNPCPLRQIPGQIPIPNEQKPRRGIVWKPKSQFVNTDTPSLKTSTGISLKAIRGNTISKKSRFHPYNMAGAQKATTSVTLRDGTVKLFSTKDTMHSEMVATQWMLDKKHWTLSLGTIIWRDNSTVVSSAEFKTTEPHCGFCSIMLTVLELPLSTPTKGNYNLAGHFNYPVPEDIKKDQYVLAKLLRGDSDSGGFNKIKTILNSFINTQKDKWVLRIPNQEFVNEDHLSAPDEKLTLDWQGVIKQSDGEVLSQIWKLVFECIYQTNDKKTK